MKKITLFSLVAATVLFTACGEETKKVAAEVNKTAVVEAIKKDTVSAVEAAKIKAAEIAEAAKIEAEKIAATAAEKTKAAKVAAEVKAVDAAAAVKEKTVELTEAATNAVASVMPASSTAAPVAPEAYAKCVGCHGADGKTKALGKSSVIAGQDKAAIIDSMNAYKAGTKNVVGMGMLMKGQAASMSDAEIEAVAEYLSQL
ncbi:cytochrome c [Sulfurovum sp.]|uniref:c-type cytochrome n=1 Tax=Sulfurovum sp. TaxID=1969726 RepID=UPI00356360CA